MAAVVGKWELVSCDSNFEKYMQAVGVSEDNIKLALQGLTVASKVSHDISVAGDVWTIVVGSPAGEKTDKYTVGQAVDTKTLDGRPVSVVYTVEGDTLVETQKGDGFESKNVRSVAGDELTMTFTANGSVSCSRVYKKIS